jgi:hypothetical protein
MMGKILRMASIALALGVATAQAEVISVNFVDVDHDKNYQIPATTAAGIDGYANWNNPTTRSGTNIALKDSDGNATAARLTFSSQNTWYNNTANSDANAGDGDAMLAAGYLDDGRTAGQAYPDIRITGLTGTYDVILYLGTDSSTGYYLPFTVNGTQYSTTGNKSTWVTGEGVNHWDISNTITITGLTGDLRVIGEHQDGNNRGSISGVQVIPEPAALGLVGMLGGAMLFAHRRFMI